MECRAVSGGCPIPVPPCRLDQSFLKDIVIEKRLRVRPQPDIDMKKHDVLRTMWKYIRNDKGAICWSVICSCVTGGCVVVQSLMIKYIVDNGISNDALTPTEKITYVGCMCLIYITVSYTRIHMYHMGYKMLLNALESGLKRLKSDVFDHVEHMGLRFQAEVSTGELQNVINGPPITSIRTYLHSLFSGVPSQLVSFVISMSALFSFDWVMTLVLFGTALAMAIINVYSRNKIRLLSLRYVNTEADANQYLVDALNGMGAIKTYAIEEAVKGSLDLKLSKAKDTYVDLTVNNQKENQKVELAQYFGIAVVYMVGTVSCIYRGITVGVLYVFLSSMTTILATLTSWLSLGLQKSSAQSGMDAILKIMNKETDVANLPYGQAKSIDAAISTAMAGETIIQFQNVEFAYEDKHVFHGLNCKLVKGESVALVGAGGSGKSTFVKLLLRLYDVQTGEVEVYGNNLKEYDIRRLRASFGVVPQSTTIFHGTIWDNVRIAHPEATEQETLRAMEFAHMNEFLSEMENGWQTIVGNGGRELSAGQRQRVGIARALLGKPEILIFDEAMSALDSKSERAVQATINMLMKDHTVIMVTQKLSAVQNADRILVFQDGEIVEDGPYDRLLQNENSLLHEMLNS